MELRKKIKEVVDNFKPLEQDEYERIYENAVEAGNANDSVEMGIDLGERNLAQTIRAILIEHETTPEGNDPAGAEETEASGSLEESAPDASAETDGVDEN